MRKVADCSKFPSDIHCTLRISGEEEEVLDAAVDHAVARHGHAQSQALREQVRSLLEDEESSGEGIWSPTQAQQYPAPH